MNFIHLKEEDQKIVEQGYVPRADLFQKLLVCSF